MSRVPRSRRWFALLPLSALAVALALVLVPGCGDDDEGTGPSGPVVLPAAWAGIWEIETIEHDCGSDVIDHQATVVDTLCAGEEISFAPDDEDSLAVSCEGSVTDTAVQVTCTSSLELEGETYSITIEVTINRSGDTMTGTVRFTVRQGDTTVECFEEEMTGTRLGPAPVPCVDSSKALAGRRIRAGALLRDLP